VEDYLHATLSCMAWADPGQCIIRSYNLLERLNLEVKRRADVLVLFPNVANARMLIGVRLFQMVQAFWTEGFDVAMAEAGEAVSWFLIKKGRLSLPANILFQENCMDTVMKTRMSVWNEDVVAVMHGSNGDYFVFVCQIWVAWG